MLNRIAIAVLAGAALTSSACWAQDPPVDQSAADQQSAGPTPAGQAPVADPVAAVAVDATDASPQLPAITIPRLTPLVVELLATLSSETSVAGDRFPIRLFEPITIDGKIAVPAGTLGEGEVIHAKGKGGMGTPGELIITARWLDLNGQRLPLRSLRVNGDGQSRIDTVNSLAVASAATIPLASLVGFFITGGAKTVNEGTVATARTAEDFAVPAATDPAAALATEPASLPVKTAPVDQPEQDGSNLEGTNE